MVRLMRHQKHHPSCKLQTDTSRREQQPRRKTEETPTWPTADPEKYILSEAFTCNQSTTGQRRAPGTPRACQDIQDTRRRSLATAEAGWRLKTAVTSSPLVYGLVYGVRSLSRRFQLALHPISRHLQSSALSTQKEIRFTDLNNF